jgi:hypothetical protein
MPAEWQRPAGWTQTRGGEGGKVIRVTSLAASGKGSLAEALGIEGARVIEFAVAGVIDLDGRSLEISLPHVTLAGETAPSPGITLINGGVGISTHDVIVRHLRIRPGAGKRTRKSGWEVDGVATNAARDVIVDHCSISWATDENLSASGPRFEGETPDEWRSNTSRRITFSHNLVGECLHDSTHAKGPHSKGSLIHDNTSGIAIHGNLYISNHERNPLFKGGARGAVINNLIHNPGSRFIHYGLVRGEWKGREWQRGAMVIVGNVARKGPSTNPQAKFFGVNGPCDAYLRDNLFLDAEGTAVEIEPLLRRTRKETDEGAADKGLRLMEKPMFWPPGLEAKAAADTAGWVLANVGARPWDRDATDRRLIEEAKSSGGKIINSELEVAEAKAGKPDA